MLAASEVVVLATDGDHGLTHLAKGFSDGEWAWVNGIENMGIDVTQAGLDFEKSFVESYIDSGPYPIEYIELRVGNQQRSVSDVQYAVQTDDVEGYEQIKVMRTEFQLAGMQEFGQVWDDFTGGGN